MKTESKMYFFLIPINKQTKDTHHSTNKTFQTVISNSLNLCTGECTVKCLLVLNFEENRRKPFENVSMFYVILFYFHLERFFIRKPLRKYLYFKKLSNNFRNRYKELRICKFLHV